MSTPMTPRVDVRSASQRFTTRIDWLDSRHSFSFGRHYDAANTHQGRWRSHTVTASSAR